eukprot:493027-Rhodomonas_salina.1
MHIPPGTWVPGNLGYPSSATYPPGGTRVPGTRVPGYCGQCQWCYPGTPWPVPEWYSIPGLAKKARSSCAYPGTRVVVTRRHVPCTTT